MGSGGREHALAWKIADSPLVARVWCAPGNAGTTHEPFVTNVEVGVDGRPFNTDDPQAILALAETLDADLTVIGPEAPLAAGAADHFAAAGRYLFGPTAAAARLEWSKAYAKDFMLRHHIPTARYEVADTAAEARSAIARLGLPVVIKVDGLAAGKGVTVAGTRSEAERAVSEAMEEGVFGSAGRRLVVEECLEGTEVSLLALTDGERVLTFPPAQDHKRAYDGDRGPNTGGMGAYAPASALGPEAVRDSVEQVLLPVTDGLAREGSAYRGVLYAGLMLTRDGPKVLEFNCRFGDPETQVLLPLLDEDLAALMLAIAGHPAAAAAGAVKVGRTLRTTGQTAVTVVMASGGYPGPYEKGKPIHGLEVAGTRSGIKVFHAGTRAQPAPGRGDRLGRPLITTAGGRVLNVTATAGTLLDAVREAYKAVALVSFEGAHYRSDIAARAL